MNGAKKMTLGVKVILVTTVLVAGTVWGTTMIAMPMSYADTPGVFYTKLITSTLMAVLHLVASALFFMGLKAYRQKLRFAYALIALGVILTALGTIQLPFIDAFDLIGSFYVQAGIVILPFLLSGLATYIGVRKFARLVSAKTMLTRAGLIIPGAIVLSGLSTLLPHAAWGGTEVAFDATSAILVWATILQLCAALIALKIRSHVGAHYVNAVAWLFLALFCGFIIELIVLVTNFVVGSNTQVDMTVNILAMLNGPLYIKAGLAFNKTKDY